MPARNGLPPAVREVAQERLAALAEGLEGADPALRRALPRVLAASGFVSGVLARDPERLRAWCKDGFFQRAPAPGALARRLHGAVAACEGDEAFMAALRRVRNAELARIALREIAGWARLDETLGELSDLAEAACQAALARAMQAVGARAGVPRDASGAASVPYVLGMGKLGGRELNFSSDIDLIFGYTAAGETDGARPLANEEFFEKVVQQMTRLLAQRTAEGFVFRVDWMLRPFGSAGPPAMGSAAMEEYYQVHGREWERYAFIKARTVAGEPAAGGALLRALQPFIYRRYLDFNAVGALRELKRTIEAEVARKDLHDNIKLGSGGIREIEFIVQAFQLMRGGKEAPLRDTRLRPVLRYLGQAGHLEPATAAALDADYVFLRRLENALQMQQDAQTHALPAAEADREAVAVALALPDWGAVEEQLAAARARVAAEFARLFAAPAEVKRGSAPDAAVSALWRGGDPAAAREALVKLGFAEDPDGLIEEIRALKDSRLARALSETSLQRLESLVAVLLDELRASARPETAARRVLQVVGAVAGRTTYLALLRESGGARAQLIRLCAASPWIAEFIAGAPAVLDQLLDERTLYAPPEQAELHAELEKRFANVAAGDTEGAMNALRLFRQEMMLRIAAADLVQALPLVKVSDRLTWLAESILARALAANRAEMAAEFGTPRRSDGAEAAFAVIAYGKFGGIEMGYGSDLDIVFLHDADVLDGETEGGGRRLANEVWLSRLAQRIVNWLSAQTALGRAYEVDLELRPDGRRGLTVSSIAGFAQYQRENAWTWEHQALTRARPVAGEARLQEAFAELRREVITRRRDEAKLRADVRDMRARMRRHLDRSTREAFDVKQGEGGLTDIEFITQYLVLRHAHAHPELAAWPDNWRQTDALVAAGVLEAGKAGALIDTYRDYRAWLHARDLQQGEGLADDSQFTAQRAAVRSLWRDLIEGA
jgi:[glutamine synthetase] adenylyltransferase / [glutamine synthetase]-adenylyl-L-tyrosine phosphorylase